MRAGHLPLPAAIGRHAVLLATSAFILTPFAWMLSLSLKSPSEIFQPRFNLLPSSFSAIENYSAALSGAPIGRFLLNGAFVAGTTLILQIAIAAPCAYALAKHEFKGKDLLFALVLVALLIPQEVLAIPLFVMLHWLGLLNTYAALILPSVVSPFGIFLFRQFFKTIPDDYVHAARLDGLGELAIVYRVMLPMAVPALVAFAILSVISRWNDLFWPLIAIRDENLMPPALGIVRFQNEEAGNAWGPLMAAAMIVVAPLILTFLVAQRRFLEGVTLSGLK